MTSITLQKILLFLFLALFTVFSYTFLHEGGHALVGLLAGGRIHTFNINFLNLSAHVGMDVNFTPAQLILNNVAGAGLPLLVWLGFMLLAPKRGNFALECLKIISTILLLSSLLAWVALPLLYLGGQAPSDDVTNFLNNSGVHPLWVTGAALALIAGGVLLFTRKIGDLRQTLAQYRSTEDDAITPAVRQTTLVLLGVFAVFALMAFTANGFSFSAPRRSAFEPPPGYLLVKQMDLAVETNELAQVCSFTLTETVRMGVFLRMEQIDSPYLEVKLSGPDGYEKIILHAEGYTTNLDIPHMEEVLQPGTYSCWLTQQPSKGRVSVYLPPVQ